MKYIKTYETTHPYQWKNIIQDGNKLYVYLYELANEMEKQVSGKDKYETAKMEHKYYKLVKYLLENKVITFESVNFSDKITGICNYVTFHAGIFGGDYDEPDLFRFDYAKIDMKI